MKFIKYGLVLLTLQVFMSGSFCSKTPLSPARTIAGTWHTNLTTPFFYYYSDVCGNYSRVAKTQIGFQMIITRLTDNTVDIQLNRTSAGPVQLLVGASCALYVPLAFPKFLTGQVSSSKVDLYESNGQFVGSFSFTTDNMNGDFNSNFDKFCGLYCSGAGTDSRAITLVK